jgi:thiamine pyrophosphokinase
VRPPSRWSAAALGEDDLTRALAIAPCLVAVDGGADATVAAGLSPQAVIGDLDSVSPDTRRGWATEIIHEIPNRTVRISTRRLRHLRVPLVLAVGFTGARLDHELAVFHSLVARPEHSCIVLGERDIVFHAPPRLRSWTLPRGRAYRFFPWPPSRAVQRVALAHRRARLSIPPKRIGTSNEATGGEVRDRDGRTGSSGHPAAQ